MTHGFEWQQEAHGDNDALVYHLHGVLGETSESFVFLEAFRQHVKDSPKHLILDLGGLEMITSTGIGMIGGCLTAANEDDRTLTLCRANHIVHRALDLTGFINMIPHYDTEEAALQGGG